MPQRVRASAQLSLCPHPEGRSFAVIYKHAAKVDIHSRTAAHTTAAEVPDPVEAAFEDRNGETRFVAGRLHYSTCWPSVDYLYVLYSGDDYGNDSLSEIGEGQSVQIFDWESGRLLRHLHLDRRIFGFSVDETTGLLYAGSLSDAGIYRFRLPKAGVR